MTVEELIVKLQSYPQDMVVVTDYGIINEDSFRMGIYYVGDSANPNCEIIEKALFIE